MGWCFVENDVQGDSGRILRTFQAVSETWRESFDHSEIFLWWWRVQRSFVRGKRKRKEFFEGKFLVLVSTGKRGFLIKVRPWSVELKFDDEGVFIHIARIVVTGIKLIKLNLEKNIKTRSLITKRKFEGQSQKICCFNFSFFLVDLLSRVSAAWERRGLLRV